MATSRERLHVPGEHIFALAPLQGSSAVELFIERASNALPQFSALANDADVRRDLATICKRLDGIPFAIELAAARVSSMSVTAIAANIDERLALLSRGSTTVPRHKTMRALIDWSYEPLSEPARRVFEDFSVFGNGCTLDVACAVHLGDLEERSSILDVLSSLVDKSLVVVDFDVDSARYSLLDTTRQYAHQKLLARGVLDDVSRRHAAAYLLLAESLAHEWNTSPNRAWHSRARNELENWRTAIQWAIVERQDVTLGQRLIAALEPVWSAFALSEGRKWCRIALELVDETTPGALVADLEYVSAYLAFLSGDLDAALPRAQRARADYLALDDRRGVVKSETIVGRMLASAGRHSEGEAVLSNALQIAKSIDEPMLVAVAHQGLGLTRSYAGDIEGASAHVEQALEIAKAQSADRVAAVTGMICAEAEFNKGNKQKAVEFAKDVVTLGQELGDEFLIMRAYSNLAIYLIGCERYDEARKAACRALQFSHLAEGSTAVPHAVQHLAMIAAVSGENARAAQLFGFTRSRKAKSDLLSEEQERERLEALLQSRLAPNELQRFLSEGAAMSEGDAIALSS